MDLDLKKLIAEARAEVDEPKTQGVKVVLRGNLLVLEFTKLLGSDWQNVTAKHPPRPGTDDKNIGYNTDAMPADYPVEMITVEGEPIDEETWRDMFAVLGSVHRENISTAMWGLNFYDEFVELRDLGKASAGGNAKSSSSPANRASRRAASKGGSPRQSRPTTTTSTDA
jgi:hypothetical protein